MRLVVFVIACQKIFLPLTTLKWFNLPTWLRKILHFPPTHHQQQLCSIVLPKFVHCAFPHYLIFLDVGTNDVVEEIGKSAMGSRRSEFNVVALLKMKLELGEGV